MEMKKYIIGLLIILLIIKLPYIRSIIEEKKDIINIALNNPNLDEETIIKLKSLSKENPKIIKIQQNYQNL